MDFLYAFILALGLVASGLSTWVGFMFIWIASKEEPSKGIAVALGVGVILMSLGLAGFMVLL